MGETPKVAGPAACRTCRGYGWRQASVPNGDWLTVVYKKTCPACQGAGRAADAKGA